FKELCESGKKPGLTSADFSRFTEPGHATEMVHFIGKDIIYFHTLFWPAMLKFSGRKTPRHVYVHGFIQLGGEKMSKSRGTGLSPLRYLDVGLNAEWLRYYIAAKLNANVEDMDFNPEDFSARVNSDLIGKYVNIASRAANFITRHFGGELGFDGDTRPLVQGAIGTAHLVRESFEARELGKAIRDIMAVADRINQEFDAKQPWVLAKDPAKHAELQDVCSRALHGFQLLTVLLAPVLPRTAARVARELFGLDRDFTWSDTETLPKRIAPYSHLMTRVDPKQLDALFEPDKGSTPMTAPTASPDAATIAIDDFLKIDLRVARIANAEAVAGSDKLLRLTLDVGALGMREVLSGIKSAYDPAKLVGRLAVVVANLAPRKMKFGVSQGMVLCAADEGPGLYLLDVDSGATPGMRVT
ncbi:MAG: methionine--tRNA ligase subunit beta, partial [Steroidobacteraceae bacterium]